jgi:hypothetical protein
MTCPKGNGTGRTARVISSASLHSISRKVLTHGLSVAGKSLFCMTAPSGLAVPLDEFMLTNLEHGGKERITRCSVFSLPLKAKHGLPLLG